MEPTEEETESLQSFEIQERCSQYDKFVQTRTYFEGWIMSQINQRNLINRRLEEFRSIVSSCALSIITSPTVFVFLVATHFFLPIVCTAKRNRAHLVCTISSSSSSSSSSLSPSLSHCKFSSTMIDDAPSPVTDPISLSTGYSRI